MKKILLLLLVPLLLTACKVAYTPVVDYHPSKGPDNAQVEIVVWSDYQCPFCKQAHEQVSPLLDQYSDRVKFTQRHYPLTSIHPLAFNAAMASECAADQEKFWEYNDTLFANQPNYKKKDLVSYAEQIGLDVTMFETCFDSREKNDVIKADMDEGKELGITGTPTFFMNGQRINWQGLPLLLEQTFATSTEE